MSKLVIELPDVPVCGDVNLFFYSSDSVTCKIDSSAELKCRVICPPNCVVNFNPSFSPVSESDLL